MKQIEFHIRLTIVDEFNDLDQISLITGIQPSDSWHKGDKNYKMRRKKNGWELKSTLPLEQPLREHVLNLLDAVEPVLAEFKKFTSISKTYLDCAIYYYDEIPFVHFEADVLKRLCELDVNIDVDLYSLGPP